MLPDWRQRTRPALSCDRQLGFVTLCLGLAAALIASIAVLAAIPTASVQPPAAVTDLAQVALPQGWAFFSANPQEVYPQAYALSRTAGWVYQSGTLALPSELFGLDRSQRAKSDEIELLIENVPKRDWRNCDGLPTRCLSAAPVVIRLVNHSVLNSLCGQVGFVRQQVLPWAWRRSGLVMPSTIVRAEVSCR